MVDSVMDLTSENDSQVHHIPKKVSGFDGTPADDRGQQKTRASYERAGFQGRSWISLDYIAAECWCRLPESNWRPFHYE